MKNLLNIFLFAGLIFSFFACENTIEPVTETKASVSMLLASNSNTIRKTSRADEYNITDQGGTAFTITESRVNVRHIQLDFPNEDSLSHNSDSTIQINIEGPFIINLMDGSSSPSIGTFKILDGIYRRIDVRLDDTKQIDGLVNSTDPMFENTLVVKGTFDYNGNPNRNFTIILKFNEDVRFEEPNGIVINDGTVKNIIVNLKVDDWFKNINITNCLNNNDILLESNGDLVINDSNGNGDCNGLEETLKQNIKNNYDVK